MIWFLVPFWLHCLLFPPHSHVSSYSGLFPVSWTSWYISTSKSLHWLLPRPGTLFLRYTYGSSAVYFMSLSKDIFQWGFPWSSYLKLHTPLHWVLLIPLPHYFSPKHLSSDSHYNNLLVTFFKYCLSPSTWMQASRGQGFLFCSLMYLQCPDGAWLIVNAQ